VVIFQFVFIFELEDTRKTLQIYCNKLGTFCRKCGYSLGGPRAGSGSGVQPLKLSVHPSIKQEVEPFSQLGWFAEQSHSCFGLLASDYIVLVFIGQSSSRSKSHVLF
jgi:hypothetical protein